MDALQSANDNCRYFHLRIVSGDFGPAERPGGLFGPGISAGLLQLLETGADCGKRCSAGRICGAEKPAVLERSGGDAGQCLQGTWNGRCILPCHDAVVFVSGIGFGRKGDPGMYEAGFLPFRAEFSQDIDDAWPGNIRRDPFPYI